jgi:anti-sigma B factor antagonist
MVLADVEFEDRPVALVARLTGEIDLTNVQELRYALLDRVRHDSAGLVLDLAGLEYLDSAGIFLLYDLANLLQARGQGLGLVAPPRCAAHGALHHAAVLDQLQAQDTVEEALAVLDG